MWLSWQPALTSPTATHGSLLPRELKRLCTITLSPVYAHFSETLAGLATIRAMRSSDRFMEENLQKLDINQRANYGSTSREAGGRGTCRLLTIDAIHFRRLCGGAVAWSEAADVWRGHGGRRLVHCGAATSFQHSQPRYASPAV